MMRMTLKTAAELAAEKRLTRELNLALDLYTKNSVHYAQAVAKLCDLTLRRNHLLAQSEDTTNIDAAIREALDHYAE